MTSDSQIQLKIINGYSEKVITEYNKHTLLKISKQQSFNKETSTGG
jgi:hypothetical protein